MANLVLIAHCGVLNSGLVRATVRPSGMFGVQSAVTLDGRASVGLRQLLTTALRTEPGATLLFGELRTAGLIRPVIALNPDLRMRVVSPPGMHF